MKKPFYGLLLCVLLSSQIALADKIENVCFEVKRTSSKSNPTLGSIKITDENVNIMWNLTTPKSALSNESGRFEANDLNIKDGIITISKVVLSSSGNEDAIYKIQISPDTVTFQQLWTNGGFVGEPLVKKVVPCPQ